MRGGSERRRGLGAGYQYCVSRYCTDTHTGYQVLQPACVHGQGALVNCHSRPLGVQGANDDARDASL